MCFSEKVIMSAKRMRSILLLGFVSVLLLITSDVNLHLSSPQPHLEQEKSLFDMSIEELMELPIVASASNRRYTQNPEQSG